MSNQVVGSRNKYTYVTHLDSPNYNGPANMLAIVVHHWGVDGQEYDAVVNTCMYGQVSAHYVLMDGLVTCLVPPGLRAWHVANNDYQVILPGVWDVNANTIGIECRPECTPGDVETLAQLIAELWCDYGKIPVYGHKDFMNTLCPGRYYDKLNAIVGRAETIYDSIINGADNTDDEEADPMSQLTQADVDWIKAQRKAETAKSPSDWAAAEVKAAGAAGITDMTRPQALATREEVFCMVYRAFTALKDKAGDTPKKRKHVFKKHKEK